MKKLYRGPYIDAYCQGWFHLARLFQRSRLKYEKVNGRTTDAKWWQYLTWPFGSGEPIKFLHFVPFHQQIWPPRAILVSDWLLFKKIFSSETAWQNGANLGRKHLCKILYKASSFGSIRPTNMAVKISSFLAHLTQRSHGLKARWAKKGNNSKIGNQILFKISG
jgi:hypothetical protein